MKLPAKNNVAEIVYEKIGRVGDPTLILISGAGAPAAFWNDNFFQGLAESGFQPVRYCHRDTGGSTHFDHKYPISELLSDLKALVELVADDPVHLVGHSMGGYLVQLAMCQFPELVVSAVSISAGPTVSPKTSAELGLSGVKEEVWLKLMENSPTGNFMQDIDGWLESWKFLNGSRPFDASLATDYTRSLYEGDRRNAEVAVNHIYAMSTVPDCLVTELEKTTTPFLAVHGSEDILVPQDHGETSARLAPAGRFQKIDGAGHMFFDKNIWGELGDILKLHCK